MTHTANTPPELSSRLRAGLARFRQNGHSGNAPHAPGLFSYCALTRERLTSVRLDRPLVGIVLSGAKEIWTDEGMERLEGGALFVLPALTPLDIVNEPDERTHVYQSLILEIGPDAVTDFEIVATIDNVMDRQFEVPLSPELVEMVLHTTCAIESSPVDGVIRAARLRELLALLHGNPAANALFARSTPERIRRLVRSDLERRWSASDVASHMGMSESTLRRRLAAEGHSLSRLLRAERMAAARRLIAQGMGSGAAAYAVGYTSRTHFARAYRDFFGASPSGRD